MIYFIATVLSLAGAYVVATHMIWVRYRVAKLQLDLLDMRDMATERASQREGAEAEGCRSLARFLNDMAGDAGSFNVATQIFMEKLPKQERKTGSASDVEDIVELFATRMTDYICEETIGGWIRLRWLALKDAKKRQEKLRRDVIREEAARLNNGISHFA